MVETCLRYLLFCIIINFIANATILLLSQVWAHINQHFYHQTIILQYICVYYGGIISSEKHYRIFQSNTMSSRNNQYKIISNLLDILPSLKTDKTIEIL